MSLRKRILVGIPLAIVILPIIVWALHPWPLFVLLENPTRTAYMKQRMKAAEEREETLEIRHRWVPLASMSPDLVRAVLVAEDRRFLEHRGVDWEALAEEVRYEGSLPFRVTSREDRVALREAWRFARQHGDSLRGRSTITQQLARNLYLSEKRSWVRKGQELLLARRLELFLSKDRILELYLNFAELGPGIFGVGAASEVYFGRTPDALTRAQAASIAATLPHPLTSNPAYRPGRMAWRRDLILERLEQWDAAGRGGTEPPASPPVTEPPLPPVIEPMPPVIEPPPPVEPLPPVIEPPPTVVEPPPPVIEPPPPMAEPPRPLEDSPLPPPVPRFEPAGGDRPGAVDRRAGPSGDAAAPAAHGARVRAADDAAG